MFSYEGVKRSVKSLKPLVNSNRRENLTYIIFLLIFYIMILQDILLPIIPILQFFDEIIALLAVPFAIYKLINEKGHLRLKRRSYSWYIIIFILIGIVSSMVYQYQPFTNAVLPDIFLNLKFWLTIYTGYFMFRQFEFKNYSKKIGFHIKIIIFAFFTLILLAYIWIYYSNILNFLGIRLPFQLFFSDVRYGLRSVKLFYSHPTFFASVCAFLLALVTIFKENIKHSKLCILLLLILMCTTMRSKSFGQAALYLLVYFLVFVLNKKIKVQTVFLIGLVCLYIGWSQFSLYFLNEASVDWARNALYTTSIDVATDHFPLGAGFATFGSHYSGVVYSPLYHTYGIDLTYGLSLDNVEFVSDVFWPMIVAQNGFIGMFIYVLALFLLFKKIQRLTKIDKCQYAASIFALGYLSVSSIAESAFVNPTSIMFALIIGICFAKRGVNS
jgi:hypothetical protein